MMNLGTSIRVNRFGLLILLCLSLLFIFYITPHSLVGTHDRVQLRQLLKASIIAAETGGERVVQVYNAGTDLKEQSKGKTKEGVNVPVTEADFKSHCSMFYGLKNLFPSVQIISEEKDNSDGCENSVLNNYHEDLDNSRIPSSLESVDSSRITVWIDPLDATKEFTEKLLQYVTTMVCVAVDGKPIMGVIHRPFASERRTIWAWLNRGKSDDILGRQRLETDPTKVLVSRSHAGPIKKMVKPVFGENAEVIEAGGSGYKSLEVAVGNFSAYVHQTSIYKWDICAGDAILTASGFRFTALSGKAINYSAVSVNIHTGGLLAAPSIKHSTYLEKIESILHITPATI